MVLFYEKQTQSWFKKWKKLKSYQYIQGFYEHFKFYVQWYVLLQRMFFGKTLGKDME